MLRRIPLFSLFVLGCSAPEKEAAPLDTGAVTVAPPVDTEPDIVVTPDVLDFGEPSVGEEVVLQLLVQNVGTGDLVVSGVTADAPFTVVTPVADLVVAPGEVTYVDVAFVGDGAEWEGVAHVLSNDWDYPDVPVPLFAGAIVPELTITPAFHDFGVTSIPCGDAVTVTLESTGEDTLVIEGLAYASGGQLALVDDNLWPMELEPGQSTTVEVTFVATTDASDAGSLEVTSNDPRGVQTAEQTAQGDWYAEQTDVFDIPFEPPVDILFAVDRSCSMAAEAEELGDAFSSFIGAIDDVTTDWQIGVVTLEDGCFNQGILDASTPNYVAAFQAAVAEGAENTMSEALLELSYLAVSNGLTGACNVGFPRPGALLHVVLVTDEPDASVTPWGIWTAGLEAVVGQPALLEISGILDLYDTCGRGSLGYVDAVLHTGGVQLDVCDANWGAQVDQIANATIEPIREYALSMSPDAATLEVLVDGAPWTTGWVYDAATEAVVFDVGFAGGEHVEITYGVLAECP